MSPLKPVKLCCTKISIDQLPGRPQANQDFYRQFTRTIIPLLLGFTRRTCKYDDEFFRWLGGPVKTQDKRRPPGYNFKRKLANFYANKLNRGVPS